MYFDHEPNDPHTKCDYCNGPIYEDELYWDFPEKGCVCSNCLDTVSARELLEFAGFEVKRLKWCETDAA